LVIPIEDRHNVTEIMEIL